MDRSTVGRCLSSFAGCAILAVAAAIPASAQGGCTSDTLSVEGTPLTTTYCVASAKSEPATKTVHVTVDETFATAKSSFTARSTFDFAEGAATSRTIEDVPLDKLGFRSVLHATLAYSGGTVKLLHALLLPGAVPLK